jgi:succinoglycan biosynthesis protein ExoM
MLKIAVCIPTYKRPLSLEKLILSLVNCKIDKSIISEVNIIVVDNDAMMTAESVIRGLIERFGNDHPMHYFSYPEKGLANVRNELLRRAFKLRPDYVAFIDDDEYADPDWINAFVSAAIRTNGDLIRGPVVSIFKEDVPVYLRQWFERPDYHNDQQITRVATNNLFIRVEALLKYQVWFDKRFNHTGGEDSFFGVRMAGKGAKIFWSSEAVVYENVPESRTNIRWIAKRYFNGANKYAYILKIEKNYRELIKKMAISIFYVLIGLIGLILLLFPFKKRYLGILKLSEGCGGLAGILNLRYNEYLH